MINWDEHVSAWSHPPVDDVGYIPASTMLSWSDDHLRRMIDEMRTARYTGYRNHLNLWRDLMCLDTTHGEDVLDFGTGIGLEALELAKAGNRVTIADISRDNLALAFRVMRLFGHDPEDVLKVGKKKPFVKAESGSFDVIHCNGVLHHIPWAREIMERFHDLLREDGEVRLMVYSDIGWKIATGSQAPHDPVEDHPDFKKFVRFFDGVGEYADWYSRDRINGRFGDLFEIDQFSYLTSDYRYCAAVLNKRRRPV
jgi:SAM-dependent methyltransferase